MIIGITGFYGAGKDTAADYLVRRKNFIHRSLSDVLRQEAAKRGIEPTRENLLKTGVDLRAKKGWGVLAEIVLEDINPDGNYVITSIRHPDEIKRLAAERNFFLVNIEAPVEIRFERLKKRNRPGDPSTLEELNVMEKRETTVSGPGQQLGVCAGMADYNIDNSDNNFETLYRRMDQLLEMLKNKIALPPTTSIGKSGRVSL